MDYSKLGISDDLINAVKSVLSEKEMHPNQKKLDKNKNGKLDADDFKKLRGESACDEEVEELDELSKKTLGSYVKKASQDVALKHNNAGMHKQAGASKVDSNPDGHYIKANNLQDKGNSRVKNISKAVDKLTKEEVEELDERNKENATRRKMMDASRGARWKVQNKMSGDDVRDWDGKHKTPQAQNKAIGRALRNEEVEELYLEDYSLEELEDFMMSEDYEQLDELSKKTLGSYVKKAADDITKRDVRIDRTLSKDITADTKEAEKKQSNRKTGISKAVDKLTKEEVEELYLEYYSLEEIQDFMMSEDFEQLDELSKKTLARYIKHSATDALINTTKPDGERKPGLSAKRQSGIFKASDKLAKEEVEELDELSKKTLGSYVKKASDRKAIAAVGMMNIRDPDSGKHMDKFQKRNMGIKKAVDKLTKEEVEELDELSKKTLGSYVKKASLDGIERTRKGDKSYNVADKLSGDNKKSATDKYRSEYKKADNRISGISKAVSKLAKESIEDYSLEELEDFMMSEDFEQLDELSKKTLGSYVKKASDYKAASMAGIVGDRGEGQKSSVKNFVKRDKGLRMAVDKLTKEQYEEIEALATKHGLVGD